MIVFDWVIVVNLWLMVVLIKYVLLYMVGCEGVLVVLMLSILVLCGNVNIEVYVLGKVVVV